MVKFSKYVIMFILLSKVIALSFVAKLYPLLNKKNIKKK